MTGGVDRVVGADQLSYTGEVTAMTYTREVEYVAKMATDALDMHIRSQTALLAETQETLRIARAERVRRGADEYVYATHRRAKLASRRRVTTN